jgi:large subunit ribosomal protein L21
MYAIVKIAGRQFRVEESKKIRVPLLNVESGNKVEFDSVLVYNDDKNTQIGTPTVDKVKVSATVIEHNREKKIIVFKKKRRKGYQVKNGHRQHYSLILVDKIGAGSVAKPKAEEVGKKVVTLVAKKTAAVEEKPKTAAVKEKTVAKPKTAAKPAVKKTVTKPADKAPAEKKAVKKPAAKASEKKEPAKKAPVKKAEPKAKKE